MREGAGALHVYPEALDEADTLEPAAVADVLIAIRTAVPHVPAGVTTGAWTAPDPAARVAAIARWTVLPDFASVNWHEPGAVAEVLLDRGVGVEAGLWQDSAVQAWRAWADHRRCCRVLLEVVGDLPAAAALAHARALVGRLGDAAHGLPVLLHGEGTSCWPVFHEALRLGLDARIGLEDVLVLPDGAHATGNGELVAAARRLIDAAGR